MKIKPTCAPLSAKLMREIKFQEFYNFLWLAFEIGKKTCKKSENQGKGGKEISLRRIGRKSLRKLFKLASFCSRHEWSPREIENYLNFSNLTSLESKEKFLLAPTGALVVAPLPLFHITSSRSSKSHYNLLTLLKNLEHLCLYILYI